MIRGKSSAALGMVLGLTLGGVEPSKAAISELLYTEPSLLFGSSFESGALVHGDDWNISGNAPTITSERARAGRYAVKSYLHRYHSDPSYRTELRARAPTPPKGKDTWYGFSVYLPGPYSPDNLGEILAQWHAIPDPGEDHGNPPIALVVEDATWKLRITSNPSSPTKRSAQQQTTYKLGPQDTNEWTDWVLKVKWSYGSDGVVQVWKNGSQVLSRTGPNCFNDEKMPYFKMGIYKSPWRSKVGSVTERVVYHDEFRMAGSGASYYDVVPGRNR